MIKAIVTVGYVGLMRPASGTWGSLAALIIGAVILFQFGPIVLAVCAGAAYAIGLWAVSQYTSGDADPSEVVIDELVGQWIALLPVGLLIENGGGPSPIEWGLMAASFFLFRLFDIWKPSIIGWADRKHGATGIMLDDVFAGFFAAIVVYVIYAAFIYAVIASNPWGQ